jgi:nucleotidyltransferase/DNA polymerase involved in DNA repair
VENGCWLSEAQAKCPALVSLPYDYEAYESVARHVLALIRERVTRVKVLSCDECLVDISSAGGIDRAEELIANLRQAIYGNERCRDSTDSC